MALRAASLLAFAAPLLLTVGGRRRFLGTRPGHGRGDRVPLLANLTAFGLFLPSLLALRGTLTGYAALVLALAGCLLAVAGAALVLRSRMELGPAWSFVPMANEVTGLVTTGPYRLARHPIYLGFSMLAMGEALAFAGRWPALFVVLSGIVPTFLWRASAEEKLLTATFGDRYARSRKQARMSHPPSSLNPLQRRVE